MIPIDLEWEHNVSLRKLEQQLVPSPQSLCRLHRLIERQYQSLPWPSALNKIAVVTQVAGGRGDISAAAKVINVMQKMCPSLTFDWVLIDNKYDAKSFLNDSNSSLINIRNCHSLVDTLEKQQALPKESNAADFLIVGPVKNSWDTINDIERPFKIMLKGPRLNFLENAASVETQALVGSASCKARDRMLQENLNRQYQLVHEAFFNCGPQSTPQLAMGLQEGTGVFLDEKLLNSPLSYPYCCTSYLFQLKDLKLQKDIFDALGLNEEQETLKYENHSLNFGYAHWTSSWSKFIDFVAIHEREKNLIIILNQVGEYSTFLPEKVFNDRRLNFLKSWGYATVIIKNNLHDPLVFKQNNEADKRQLTLILRPYFHPEDMKCLQLASERLLATGDNTAAESWSARCKLYAYEDVDNGGCKNRFLRQQIDLANTISLALGTFLRIFGKNKDLSEDEMSQIIDILKQPSFSEETLQFCQVIAKNYSFKEVLEGALKRIAWNYCIPELIEVEADAMDQEFKSALIEFLKSANTSPQVIHLKNLHLLRERVQFKVQQFLNKTSKELVLS